jgi:hypothetical protein
MKKTLGYGFKLANESLTKAFDIYTVENLCKNKKEVLEDIKRSKEIGEVSKSAKPQIFRVIVETV